MRVIIVGAGQVGSSIAESLDDDHEVVVIDTDDSRVESLTYSLDVLAIEGDGTSLATLREADVGAADLFIASTDDDETNIVTCATAKTASDAFTIARVRSTNYLQTWEESGGAFGVDFMVSTNLLAAETITRVIGLPAAQNVDVFAEGSVLLAEFCIPANSPIAGQTVAEADDQFNELTVAAVLHEDGLIVPDGETKLATGDEIVVIGSAESTRAFAADLATDRDENRDVIIIGGSQIAVQTAELLGERGLQPRLIERDPERARELAERLPQTTVMSSDATDREFLTREHVGDADVAIAALGADEKNLLASLLADRVGVDRTIAVVESAEYTDLFEAVGVDAAINPRDATAEEIIRFTLDGRMENVAIIDHDRAEVLEIQIDDDSTLAGQPITDATDDLPARVTIGAITRDGEFITPRGDTVVEVGDHVVVFVETEVVDAVASRL
ncbi:Trk system potassium transporter TrkA [Halococcus thailandensis]|uniref:Potassium transporter peripheral membrane component n=1 Tax=Halococcus thailandensis JCM 13552 TaxID=1227457 RepID=M0N1Z0_9EURY|nr:Trk system potassium transporter TrkA [Halococcus thailandensis]EMA51139.1 potassium transporter peripheral membrane component [Halococcus thailandensis JCM 13552]